MQLFSTFYIYIFVCVRGVYVRVYMCVCVCLCLIWIYDNYYRSHILATIWIKSLCEYPSLHNLLSLLSPRTYTHMYTHSCCARQDAIEYGRHDDINTHCRPVKTISNISANLCRNAGNSNVSTYPITISSTSRNRFYLYIALYLYRIYALPVLTTYICP